MSGTWGVRAGARKPKPDWAEVCCKRCHTKADRDHLLAFLAHIDEWVLFATPRTRKAAEIPYEHAQRESKKYTTTMGGTQAPVVRRCRGCGKRRSLKASTIARQHQLDPANAPERIYV